VDCRRRAGWTTIVAVTALTVVLASHDIGTDGTGEAGAKYFGLAKLSLRKSWVCSKRNI
jgi:hypothetical protein